MSCLMVPVHVDGLYLKEGRNAVGAMADFTPLPYVARKGGRCFDANHDSPWVSESVLAEPLSDTNLWLAPGTHLHWALPDALATAGHPGNGRDRGRVEFPAIPNRWIVRRRLGKFLQKEWLIESDYLWPHDHHWSEGLADERLGLVAYPSFAAERGTPPFRYLGRKRELGQDWPQSGPDKYLQDIDQRLTAVGYGEPTFAAFYPNCRSVLGLHDDSAADASALWYEVAGWYADAQDDPLAGLFTRFRPRWQGERGLSSGEQLIDAFESRFAWTAVFHLSGAALEQLGPAGVPGEVIDKLSRLPDGEWRGKRRFLKALLEPLGENGLWETIPQPQGLAREVLEATALPGEGAPRLGALLLNLCWSKPSRTLCYGRVRRPNFVAPLAARADDLKVTIADSGSEALSAYLATELASNRYPRSPRDRDQEKEKTEDYLEALLLSEPLEKQRLDIGACLDVHRHKKSFTAHRGSPLWIVRPASKKTPQDHPQAARGITLPLEVAHLVNGLNAAQQAYDRGRDRLRAMRWQLYSDWYRYMKNVYPTDAEERDMTAARGGQDVDLMAGFLKEKVIGPIKRWSKETGRIESMTSGSGGEGEGARGEARWRVECSGEENSLAGRLARLVAKVSSELASHNATEQNPADHWVLQQVPGPRYWAPNEPAVLLTGPSAQPSDRHGQDGRLHEHGLLDCHLLDDPGLWDADSDARLQDAIAKVQRRADSVESQAEGERIGFRGGVHPLRHPFMLEWQVEIAPVRSRGNMPSGKRRYAPDFIRSNWSLGESENELSERAGLTVRTRSVSSFRGRSLLTNYAHKLISQRLEAYILRRLDQKIPVGDELQSFFESHSIPDEQRNRYCLAHKYEQIRHWIIQTKSESEMRTGAAALTALEQVGIPSTQAPVKRVHGLPDGHALARGVVRFVNAYKDEIVAEEEDSQANGERKERIFVLQRKAGLDAKVALRLHTAAQGIQITSLEHLDSYLKAGPGPLVRLLRYAEANSFIAPGVDPQKVLAWPDVHGLPDNGSVAAGILALVNQASAEELEGKVGLPPRAVELILTTRQIHPLESLTQLAALHPVAAASFARLLTYADVEGYIGGQGQAEPPGQQGLAAWEDEYGHAWADPLLTAFEAWHSLNSRSDVLVQALSGFNDALLMRRQSWQLPIDDPLGFDEYRALSQVVREAVGEHKETGPLTLNDFHPIRSGDMGITRLRLVDTFGRPQEINCNDVLACKRMETSRPLQVKLPPRLTQPARLGLRWLTADEGVQEWNSHPALTPICGWLVPNNLEGSLAIYDNQGRALGAVDQTGRWRVSPAATSPLLPEEIANPHLRRMAMYLCRHGDISWHSAAASAARQSFVARFGGLLETALEQIDPETFQHQEARALLFGRPLALVRARVAVELKDPYAAQQSMLAFGHELQGRERSTDGFEQVRFPIRIGEHLRFNDGVAGYWVDDQEGYRDDSFFAPQSHWARGEGFKVYRRRDGALNLWLSLADEPLTVAVLMDPRAQLHAACGLLPAKAISLPPDQYLPALNAINVSFLTAPVLTDRGRINLPLAEEPGWSWHWTALEDGRWNTIPAAPAVIELSAFTQAFPNGADIWNELLRRLWLKRIPGEERRAWVRDPKERQGLDEEFRQQQDDIRHLFDISARAIGRPSTRAGYLRQELREGWLSLKPNRKTGSK